MPLHRTRLAVALTSLAVIALELALMRALSLRFWHHFAYMIISVALLGFGASGTILTLLRRWIVPNRRRWLFVLAAAFALSIPISLQVARQVPLRVESLAWDLDHKAQGLSALGNVAILEVSLFVPFFLAAGVIGVVLTDVPGRVSGHYAANLLGSGAGAVLAVAMMHVVDTAGLIAVVTATAAAAAAVVAPWKPVVAAIAAVLLFAGRHGRKLLVAAIVLYVPHQPILSPGKMLPQVLLMPGTEVIHRAEGPLGRIDVVAGPTIHHTPGLSLQYTHQPPPHVLLIVDGDQTSSVYHCRRRDDWRFLDYTTAAAPYHLRKQPSVLVIGAGGGSEIGLALFHGCTDVVGLEMNGQVIETMTGPLAERGGDIYEARGVRVEQAEARGYLAGTKRTFDVIQLPAIDAFGASGAGLQAAQECYLYTVEAVEAMLGRLRPGGLLCLTRWARTPPRDGLRLLETAATALRKRRREPSTHLAMIRNYATVTLLVSEQPLSEQDVKRLRWFCRGRSFDVCYFPGIRREEANQYHVLLERGDPDKDGPDAAPVERPYYYEGARALLGLQRKEYLANYMFELAAATDEKPFFYHFFGWRSLEVLREQSDPDRRDYRVYLELGYLLLLATLGQAVALALVMILLPLVPGVSALWRTKGRAAALGYFSLLGVAFMLLEMGFLQKLILYLAHPIYSAAVVIASFLIFAGLGSHVSRLWRAGTRRVIACAAGAVVLLAAAYLLGLDELLGGTQGEPMWARFLISAGVIAPLAFAMGHMFPSALRGLAASAPRLVPWAWAVNGFASVAATVAAPLLAMSVGFSHLILVAVGAYALAGLLGACCLPETRFGGSGSDS